MQSDYTLYLTLGGDSDQLRGMLEIVRIYARENCPNAIYLVAFSEETGIEEIDLANISDDMIVTPMRITVEGVCDGHEEFDNASLFKSLAETYPEAVFVATLSGDEECKGYEIRELECELTDGLLNMNRSYQGIDECDSAWMDDFKRKLPWAEFNQLFQINTDEFSMRDYTVMIMELCKETGAYQWSGIDYYEFVNFLEENGTETEIDEEKFKEIVATLGDLGIKTFSAFEHDYQGFVEHYIYDPCAKKYIEKPDRPLFDEME